MSHCLWMILLTAMGEFPVECVKTMDKIATKIEDTIKYWKRFKNNKTTLSPNNKNRFKVLF